ncbi:MAG: carboxy terminal-processing peptidase, partial [Proteobacteria bacterium]|nr:carboxy terminal-processing peptidase [Pseudomonadota bacterium]
SLALSVPGFALVDPDAGAEPLKPLPIHATTTRSIVEELAGRHYVTATLNDDLSSRIFDAYLTNMDASKSYLLASDVSEFEVYRFRMDESLKRGDLQPAFAMWNRYQERLIHRLENVVATLEQGIDEFDFSVEDELELDREDAPWATSEAELDEWWAKRIKHAVLNLKLAGKENDNKIQELLIKRYKNRIGLTRQTRPEDVYQVYINSFTETYDPHTQYYSPRNTENFNINMSLSLEGIGAVLQQEDEYTKVVSLVPAGPADKSRQLKPNDKIIGVGQGEDGEIVDVIGWRLTDVVQLIRGKKDTRVKLTIIPSGAASAEVRTISIVRNTVKLEEQSAKSRIIELEHFGQPQKVGVIDIPTFYSDFQALQAGDKNYKSTTRDVRGLLAELTAEGVDGIIIDLRNNGGGSLTEARTMTGLFIDRGPVVQLRYKNNQVDIHPDRDPSVAYSGPLAVMVNRLSASASEIFAGAIQDYQRGVIIGSQTFGKGTVQTIVPLPMNRGQLKMTQAKFYRISGESNQHRGVIPDIHYPDSWDPETIGESALENPLPWDTIRSTSYRTKSSILPLLPDLRSLHDQRIRTDPEFAYAKDVIAYRREQSNASTVSLNMATRQIEKEESDHFLLTLENRKRVAQGLTELASLDELDQDNEPDVASSVPVPGVPMVDESGETVGAGNEQSDNAKSTGEVAAVSGSGNGSELAGVGPLPATGDDVGSTDIQEEDESKPDAFLMETGNILLDLISLQKLMVVEKSMEHI